VVRALQALRGVELIVAVTFVSEIGDMRRFNSPRQLMGHLGLVPSERSTGDTVRRGGITKAGNGRVRHMLVESAWTCRHPPRGGTRHRRDLKTSLTQHGLRASQLFAWRREMRCGAEAGASAAFVAAIVGSTACATADRP
jgi:transposase